MEKKSEAKPIRDQSIDGASKISGATRVQGIDSGLRKGVIAGIRNRVTFPGKPAKILEA
jgi:hypothetical protein